MARNTLRWWHERAERVPARPTDTILCLGLLSVCSCAPRLAQAPPSGDRSVSSPDGRIEVEFRLAEPGAPRYLVRLSGAPVLEESKLGLVRDDADFSTGLRLRAVSAATPVADRYEMLTAKRRQNVYRANRRVFQLETGDGHRMDVVFQVSNDGVAFRYTFPDTSAAKRRIVEEVTSYRFQPGTVAWLQPMQQAITMWGTSNVYEEFYQTAIPVGTPSPLGAGWAYPALFHSGSAPGGADGNWLLVSETGLARNWAGTRLRHESPGGEYSVGMPDPRERREEGGAVNPTSSLPWSSPWRLIVATRESTWCWRGGAGPSGGWLASTARTASARSRSSWERWAAPGHSR